MADANGRIPFTAIAGTEAAPVRYDLKGQVCVTGKPGTPADVPSSDCPLEAIAYGRANCAQPAPCPLAESLSFIVILRHGTNSDGKPEPLPKGLFSQKGGSTKEGLDVKAMGVEMNYSRVLLSKQPAVSGTCPDITVGGILTQQRVIGIGTKGEPLCAPVDPCPVGTVFKGSAPNGAPICDQRPEDKCGDNSLVMGTDQFGKVICTLKEGQSCFNTLDSSCPDGATQTSFLKICNKASGGKKGGSSLVCTDLYTCCAPTKP
jgi:hypothetical protein